MVKWNINVLCMVCHGEKALHVPVPCMVCLPHHGHTVTRGSLWNMHGPIHTSPRGPGIGLLSNIVEWEYTSCAHQGAVSSRTPHGQSRAEPEYTGLPGCQCWVFSVRMKQGQLTINDYMPFRCEVH